MRSSANDVRTSSIWKQYDEEPVKKGEIQQRLRRGIAANRACLLHQIRPLFPRGWLVLKIAPLVSSREAVLPAMLRGELHEVQSRYVRPDLTTCFLEAGAN